MLDEVDEDDSVLIALAGHGVQFQGENESYFCPADARLADKSTLIPLSEIYKALENSRAGLKVLLVTPAATIRSRKTRVTARWSSSKA